jgi:murein DD-endopeptidase MepM/ murein hydrolase activator NlpD
MLNFQKARLISICFLLFITFSISSVFGANSGVWHVVRKGETVWGISRRYKAKPNLILKYNSVKSPRRLTVGKKLFIPGGRGLGKISRIRYKVKSGDTIWSLARRYNVSMTDIIRANNIKSPDKLRVGNTLFIPQSGLGEMGLPLRSSVFITSGYGYRIHPISRRKCFHHGIDLRARTGTRIYAVKSGRVIFVGWKGGYGKLVIVKHSDGFTTRYGHLNKIYVNHWQRVSKGTTIGTAGSTGYVTGPHLHFEVRYKGKSIDPTPYVR